MILGKLRDMIIHSDLKELFQLLNESLVEYVVVGVGWNGSDLSLEKSMLLALAEAGR